MEDQFSDSSFDEANRLINSAFNSPYAMHHAKNVAIRKQLLESAIQKLLEGKTFYISDVRDIAAMNNRVFDSRSKLYEQMNILNCREYRKMRLAVLELLPLMIHRATGIPEQRFAPIVEANRPAAEPATASAPTAQAPAPQAAAPAVGAPASPSVAAAAEAASAARASDAGPSVKTVADRSEARSAAGVRPSPLLLSLGLNLLLGAALLVSVLPSVPDAQAPHGAALSPAVPARTGGAGGPAAAAASSGIAPASHGQSAAGSASKPYVVDSVIRTASPADSLSQMATALSAEKAAGQQYIIGVRVEKVVN